MASTTSSLLKLELQTTGENASTWGTKLNNVVSEAEKAITGEVEIDMAGSADVTLTDVDYNTSEGRYAVLKLTGAITGNVKVIVPARTKWFYVINATTQTTTYTFSCSIGTASGTSVAIPNNGLPYTAYCDGTNVVSPQSLLPSFHIATSTDISLDTDSTQLTFGSADVVSDPYSITDHANNRIVFPSGYELMLVQMNCMTSLLDDTTTLGVSIFTNSFGGAPGSAQIPAIYEGDMTTRGNTNLKGAQVCAVVYNPLQIHTLNGTTRQSNITFGARVQTGTTTMTAFEINGVVLK